MPIVVELWNARGIDQPMPALEKLSKLRVSFSSESISRQGFLIPAAVDAAECRSIPARQAATWKQPLSTLGAHQVVLAASFDLRASFDFHEQGFYRVSLGNADFCFSQGPMSAERK